MSRVGKKPIEIPSGVKVAVDLRTVNVEGPKGNLKHTFPYGVNIAVEGSQVKVSAEKAGDRQHRAFQGLTRALIANMVKGVKEPFQKVLEIHGTGFGANLNGDTLTLDIGFSNKIDVKVPGEIEVKIDKGRPVVLTISGADKQAVGQLAATIRSKRPPTPYGDNTGVRYRGEFIRKKAGKGFGDKK
ncbi:MAG: 50S ribosomal protein L6 [Planctomycetota bacterium]